MSRASGIEHLKPFFPGLERHAGRFRSVGADDQRSPTTSGSRRPGSSILMKLPPSIRLDPSEGGHSHCPAAGPGSGRQTHHRCVSGRWLPSRHLRAAGQSQGWPLPMRRFRRPCFFSPRPGSARRSPREGLQHSSRHAALPAQHPGLWGNRLGQDYACSMPLSNSFLENERIVAIEDTLELRIERANCLRFEAGQLGEKALSPSGSWSGMRCATGPITSWWER